MCSGTSRPYCFGDCYWDPDQPKQPNSMKSSTECRDCPSTGESARYFLTSAGVVFGFALLVRIWVSCQFAYRYPRQVYFRKDGNFFATLGFAISMSQLLSVVMSALPTGQSRSFIVLLTARLTFLFPSRSVSPQNCVPDERAFFAEKTLIGVGIGVIALLGAALACRLRKAALAFFFVKLLTGFVVSASVAILTCQYFGQAALLDNASPVSCPREAPDIAAMSLAYVGIVLYLIGLPVLVGLYRYSKREPALGSDFKPAYWYMEYLLLLESALIYFAPLSAQAPKVGLSVTLAIVCVALFAFILWTSPWVLPLQWMRSTWVLVQCVVFVGALAFATGSTVLAWMCVVGTIIAYLWLEAVFGYACYAFVKRPLPAGATLDTRCCTRNARDGFGVRVILPETPVDASSGSSRDFTSWLRTSSRALFGQRSEQEDAVYRYEHKWHLPDKAIDSLVRYWGNSEPYIPDGQTQESSAEAEPKCEDVEAVSETADARDNCKQALGAPAKSAGRINAPSVAATVSTLSAEAPADFVLNPLRAAKPKDHATPTK